MILGGFFSIVSFTASPVSQDTFEQLSRDRCFFANSRGKPTIDVETRVKLSEGVNLVTLVAKDSNGIEKRRSLMVRKR